jgi:predicted CXXCH cytochrome family protein
MQAADSTSVLGNFDNTSFANAGVTSTFFRREGKYWVRTDDATGTLREFPIKYTFGVAPLQQYLIEMPDGRIQALTIAWDSRPRRDGGQRWFHLYPNERIGHADELHWTGRLMNWNFMCADCHSTNIRKGYDAAHDRFQTTWSEISVGCEACHGPGSLHVTWAKTPPEARAAENGLTVHFFERSGARWNLDPATGQPRRSEPRTTSVEIDVCAQCHSRRAQIAEGYRPGAPFEDYYVPSAITRGLYYPDGQQRDEVYIYGSFLESRMAQAGVTCADCHEPHGQKVRAPGNRMCVQCHAALKYDSPDHHFHKTQSAGAQCVSCHMAQTTYMVLDPRRDHSFRVPRPDRSERIGVPNACNSCHRDRSARWADEQIRRRTGRQPAGFQTFAEAFFSTESNEPSAPEALRRIADDRSQPALVRASALERLAGMPGPAAFGAADGQLPDVHPAVRRAALAIVEALPPEQRISRVAPLLRDRIRSVRIQAAWLLAPVSGALAGTADADAFSRAADEFVAARRGLADRPEDRTALGSFFAQLGRRDEAAAEYRAAMRLAPKYTPAYVNLSDLQREGGNEPQAERTLREGLGVVPADAMLHHALGLSLARSGRTAEALDELKRASDLSSETRLTYAYAVALHSSGKVDEAVEALERALARDPGDRDVLFALATFHRDAGRIGKALRYAEQLRLRHPDDPEAEALVSSLRSR